jgi:hypothetical protein
MIQAPTFADAWGTHKSSGSEYMITGEITVDIPGDRQPSDPEEFDVSFRQIIESIALPFLDPEAMLDMGTMH